MANEFIARKGLIVLENGAKITGSLGVQGDIDVTGNTILGNQLSDLVKITGSLTTSGSNTFTGTQTVNGNVVLGNSGQIQVIDATKNTLFGFYNGSSILGSYYQMFGNLYSNTTQRGSAEFVFDTQFGGESGFNVAEYNGSTWLRKFRVSPIGAEVTGSLNVTGGITGSFFGDGSQLTGIVSTLSITGSTGTDEIPLKTEGLSILGSNGLTTTVTNNTVTINLPAGTVTASSQVDVRNTTGIATIATTGSNTFTGIQNISNTTNSTNYLDGALIVAGGVGIGKDVNISGSVNILGLLTVASMSTQYVTSSQYTIGTSRVIVNDDDLVRFAGLSVVDSGSSSATGSLLWDSLKNHWIYEREDGGAYKSAIVIAGPKNYGNVGDEEELVPGRIPVATGGDHIDTNAASSSIYIDFADRRTYIEAGLYVTGSVTSSLGFSGDGSQLTGIVTNLNITGSDGGTGTVSLKTQSLTVDGENGIAATVSGQTLTISGSNATTTARGVATFTGSNFTVVGGNVSANPITFNDVPLNLGSTYAFGLQNITPYGASTDDQVTLNGGAVIRGTLFTSGSNLDIDIGTEIIATVSTSSRDAAFFDYVVKKATNYRVGTVMAVWDSNDNVEFTDTSTNDLGNTGDVSFSVDALSGFVRLKATVASNDWIVKTAIRTF